MAVSPMRAASCSNGAWRQGMLSGFGYRVGILADTISVSVASDQIREGAEAGKTSTVSLRSKQL